MTDNATKKHYRNIAHTLSPVVTIADKGMTPNVQTELARALDDHELIKVKLAIADRDSRKEICAQLCKALSCEVIQQIGKVVVLFRAAKKPNPRLSNLLRK